MVKNIILHLNEELFFLMKQDKVELECQSGSTMTWEDYVQKIFEGKKNDRR